MNGLGGLNNSVHGGIGLVQLQLPVTVTKADLARNPDLVREARLGWGVENNIYQMAHRGYVAVSGGSGDAPYSYMHDLVAGRYRLHWEDEIEVKDGTSCGSDKPVRRYGETLKSAAE